MWLDLTVYKSSLVQVLADTWCHEVNMRKGNVAFYVNSNNEAYVKNFWYQRVIGNSYR